jgi:murein L,D-transpeptidase YafK
MKTAFFLSCLFVGGSLLYNTYTENSTTSSAGLPAYTTTKAKRSTVEMPSAPLRIVIDKSDYELHVYDSKGWYATYPVVFGNDPMKDKKMEGDRCTPEGNFKIVAKRPHDKWHRFLALDYPTPADIEKFNQRKQRGEIPKNARPGGAIGIHGTWPNDDMVVDRYKNWTLGCISLKNSDVQELYKYLGVGTPVHIKK